MFRSARPLFYGPCVLRKLAREPVQAEKLAASEQRAGEAANQTATEQGKAKIRISDFEIVR